MRVCRLDELPLDGAGLSLAVDGYQVAVFLIDGKIHALDDSCPHLGGSLGLGVVKDGDVTCPWHGFHFCLSTGESTDGLDESVRIRPTRQSGECVEVAFGTVVAEGCQVDTNGPSGNLGWWPWLISGPSSQGHRRIECFAVSGAAHSSARPGLSPDPFPTPQPCPSMEILEIPVEGYERVARCRDEASGLEAIIAVHDTTLGPALGGMRMLPYASDDEALTDVLRLSRGMTFKSAVADTGLGGGKSVIIGNPSVDKSEALFLAMGRFIEAFGGKYITAEDMNIGIADLEIVKRETRWVTGLSKDSGSSGNPSPYTAYGCLVGIKATCQEAFGTDDLTGRRVVIQGIGAVGGRLAVLLKEAGALVTVCDIKTERADSMASEYGFQVVDDADHLDVECDIYAPCARGAGINDQTIPRLRCKVVAGCANNMLLEPSHAEDLRQLGILYAPDYVINAGGIVNVSVELQPGGYDEAAAIKKIDHIAEALCEVYGISKAEDIPTNEAAQRLAQRRLAAARS